MSPRSSSLGALPANLARAGAYVRFSVTDRCDLRCRYCRDGARGVPAEGGSPLLGPGEVVELVSAIDRAVGVRKVRLTGGEPLLRPDLVEIVAALRAALPAATLGLTTNGRGLAREAAALRHAGLDAVNVSLDAIDPDRYEALTGGRIGPALSGLEAAAAAGFAALKVNAVLLASANGDRLAEIVRVAAAHGAEPRFIELMPSGPAASMHRDEYLSAPEALDRLRSEMTYLRPLGRSGAAERHELQDGGRRTVVGLISPVSRPFCESCDRLRVDARGRLLTCLRQPARVDLAAALRGRGPEAVEGVVEGAVALKHAPAEGWTAREMSAIGG